MRPRPARRRCRCPTYAPFGSGSLDEAAAKALFAGFGVPVAREVVVGDAEAARAAAQGLGDSVVLKILSAQITHKSDVGGVAVNVAPAAIAARMARMAAEVEAATGAAPARYLIQEMVRGGVEVILGMHRDALGTAILLGMGGVAAELFGDTAAHAARGPRPGPRRRHGDDRRAEDRAAAVRLPRASAGRRGGTGRCHRGLFTHGGVAGRAPARGGDQPGLQLPQGQGVVAADGVAVLAGAHAGEAAVSAN